MNLELLRNAATLLLLLSVSRATCAGVVACPSTLQVEASANAPAGWESIPSNDELPLIGVTIYSGPPRNHVSLMPSELPSRHGLYLQQWDLHEEPWLECRYKEASIARQLPKELKSCIAYYRHPQRKTYEFVRLECE